MSGHSKWKTIKHQKGAADAKRGNLFTKLTRDIGLAVRQGGTDPESNYRLRLAMDKARSGNMPSDTIERAIKRASGEGEGMEHFEELIYEGYAPGGAAVMLQALTPNRNRTAAEIRSVFTKRGASLGESGCVSWNFESKGILTLEVEPEGAEDVALLAIDAGADDVQIDGKHMEVYTLPDKLETVTKELERQGIKATTHDISMVPKTTILLGPHEAEQALKLLDSLEELPDVQKVYTNADFPDEVLEQYRKEG